MANGVLNVWEAGALTDPREEYGDGLVAQIELYPGSDFNCLEWNPKKRELLATGGNSVLIVNIEKSIDEPEVIPPNTKKDADPITDVAWNPTAPHILASVSAGGLVNVWDLKGKKSFCNFRDKSGETAREPKISWNPSSASHLAVVFDQGKEAGVQIWDLRNTKVPVSVLKDNHKNARLNGVDWVAQNPQLILSSNRSGAVTVEHSKTLGAPVYQFQSQKDVVDVKWADQLESIFAIQDVEGGISIQTTDTEMVKKISTTHAPKWMKNTSAVSAVSGSNSALFFRDSTPALSQITLPGKDKGIRHEINTLSELVDANDHQAFCEYYAQSSPDLWKLLGTTNAQSFRGTSRESNQEKILAALGFNYDDILSKTENATGKSHRKKKNSQTQRRQSGAREQDFDLPEMTEDQAEKFFNQGHAEDEDADQTIAQGDYYSNEIDEQEVRTTRNENWDAGLEDLIRRNLMIGNFHGAVDCAIKAGRFAHAFLIAYAKKDSPELLDLAAEGIAMLNNDNISGMLQNMIEDKAQDIIESYDLTRWKELTAFVLSNYPESKNSLLKQLAGRLQQSNRLEEATCVCLLADDFQSVEDMISSVVENPEGVKGAQYEELLLQNFTILLGINNSRSEKSRRHEIQESLIKFAHILIDYSEPKLALSLLKELGDHSNEEIVFLESCIYYAHQSTLSLSFEAPDYSHFQVKITPPFTQSHTSKQAFSKTTPATTGKAGSVSGFKAGPQPPTFKKPAPGTTASSRRDADADSLVSDIDPSKLNPKVIVAPVAPTPGMPKQSGPTRVGPPPPVKAPPVSRGQYEDKSTEEVVDQLSQQGPVKRPGPPPPKAGMPAPPKPATPAGPPKSTAGPPPVTAPPKISPPAPPARPAPAQPEHVQSPPPAGPARPPGPPPPRPVGPPPPAAPAPPKAVAPPLKAAPPPVTQAPPAPVAPPTPVAAPPRAAPPAPPAPARPAPPTPAARPGPPAPVLPQPPRAAGPPPAQPPGPPKATAAPPTPAPPKTSAPPPARPPGAGVPPPRAGVPPPRGPPPVGGAKPPAHQSAPQDEEVDVVKEVVDGLQKSAEFIEDFVKGPELDLQRNALNQIINEIRAGKAKEALINHLYDFFNHLSNEDLRSATLTLTKVRQQSGPKDGKWIKAIETVLNNYADDN